MPMMHDYCVFISYSHLDSELVDQIVTILCENGLRLMLDKDFSIGGKFTELIKNFIAHAHVFVLVHGSGLTIRSADTKVLTVIGRIYFMVSLKCRWRHDKLNYPVIDFT